MSTAAGHVRVQVYIDLAELQELQRFMHDTPYSSIVRQLIRRALDEERHKHEVLKSNGLAPSV